MRRHLVIGYYPEDGQRCADSYDTETPEEAERLFKRNYGAGDVRVAGVVALNDKGEMEVVS